MSLGGYSPPADSTPSVFFIPIAAIANKIENQITPIRDKQFFFFLKKSFNKSLKRGLCFVYLLLKINHITK